MTDTEALAQVEAEINALLDLVDDTASCGHCGSAFNLRPCRGCLTYVCPDCRTEHAHAVGSYGETEQFQY